ncbi:hypothetical protein [Paractinoplanes atraurantiacus]|uniref:Uncharacterized protein n=1 Tax=Paractinoplanes atraurantiacus TaxID=1036182 RepID=A0A285KN91_9ACTN|nr:hypothetical protein [Actinoplanes atraurantiacus]SNY72751.1 hypothetical protein SAMN05421748_1444 [Actinoplanes atraurantiacus]
MAGHRSVKAAQPAQYEVRQQRRRARMAVRLAEATTPSARIGAVADHLRAALADLPGPAAEQIAALAIETLNAAVEQAYREEARVAAARTRPR